MKWEEVPAANRHGDVTGYVIFYKEKLDLSATDMSIGSIGTTAELHGLKQDTWYVMRIVAYTKDGNGVISPNVYRKTKKKGR